MVRDGPIISEDVPHHGGNKPLGTDKPSADNDCSRTMVTNRDLIPSSDGTTGRLHKSARPKRKTPSQRQTTDQRGMVTVEIAIGMIFLTLVTGFLVWIVCLFSLQARCQDSATLIARQIARGDTAAAEEAKNTAPEDATVTVTTKADDVLVEVNAEYRFGTLQAVPVAGKAVITKEPGS